MTTWARPTSGLLGLVVVPLLLLGVSGCAMNTNLDSVDAASSSATAAPATVTTAAAAAATPVPTQTLIPAPVPADSGARDSATGSVAFGANDVPITYTVAENDKLFAIADRFGIDVYGLTHADGIRYQPTDGLWPGDVLTFEPWSPSCRNDMPSCFR